jgi:lysophospholipase L1-like esterase
MFLKPKIVDLIKKDIFLPNPCTTDGYFIATDNIETYNKHLKTMSTDWYYRTNTVNYTVNKHQYRTDEFDTIDWANSIVLLGCSQTYGVGVTDEDTIGSNLSKLLNKPVINLGIPGASNNLILNNSAILSSKYPTPLIVIHIYSEVYRTTEYQKRQIVNHGSWTMDKDLMKSWSEEITNSQVQTLMASKISNEIWNHKTKFLEFSSFTDSHLLLKCKNLFNPFKDYARDNMHFGRKTTKKFAELIAKEL